MSAGCTRGRRAAAVLVLVVLAAGSAAAATGAASRSSAGNPHARVGRVLVISLPEVDWSDVAALELPNLERLFRESAIGGMVTNGALRPSNAGASYMAIGAGARSVAPASVSGQGFGVDERFGRDRAGVAFTARTGTPPGDGLVYMAIADVVEANDGELYGAEPGLLGAELAANGVSRAVIANGDGSDPSTPEQRVPPYRRAAVAGLMSRAGRVPGGQVDRDLLQRDPDAPFGLRLDQGAVLDAFTASFTDRSVVLVEASDLVRAALAARFASEDQGAALLRRALRASDRLVGALLDEVDPERDAVLVVGPAPPRDEHGLTIASMRAPGVDPGWLVSTSTNHDGFVNVIDVAPTILRLLGIHRPDGMEGRPMSAVGRGGSTGARISTLVDVNTDGAFRDSQVGIAMTVVVVLCCLLTVAVVVTGRWWRPGRVLLLPGASGLLAFLDATYLAAPLHLGRHGGAAAYWPVVAVTAVVLAAVFLLVGRAVGGPIDGLLVGLGSVVALHLVDLVSGAHLEWNAVFGYSPTIGIRLVGQGNLTFAQLVAAAVLFSGLIAWRVRPPAGTRIAIAVLAVTVVVMGAPFWGNDFGSVVSAVPAFALMTWLLLGRRLTVRSVAGILGVAMGAVVAVGLVDLLRPADERTHVGKFLVKLSDDTDAATLAVRRKASENLSVLTHSVLLGAVIVVVLLLAYLWFVHPRALRAVAARVATANATAVGFLVVATLGFVLNDSGVTIPGMMVAVLLAAVVYLVTALVPAPEAASDP